MPNIKNGWVDWQKIAVNHAKKGVKVNPPPQDPQQELKNLEDWNNWWANWKKPPAPPQPHDQHGMFIKLAADEPEQQKLVVEEVPLPPEDDLHEVEKELEEIVKYAEEEVPTTLIRALKYIKKLKNGQDWMNGYKSGWNEAKHQYQDEGPDVFDGPDL